jgi:hypothetical protein
MGLTTRGSSPTLESVAQDPKMSLTGVEAMGTKIPKPLKQTDKRSIDYILRSGLAGGLAGCAVSSCLVHGTLA